MARKRTFVDRVKQVAAANPDAMDALGGKDKNLVTVGVDKASGPDMSVSAELSAADTTSTAPAVKVPDETPPATAAVPVTVPTQTIPPEADLSVVSPPPFRPLTSAYATLVEKPNDTVSNELCSAPGETKMLRELFAEVRKSRKAKSTHAAMLTQLQRDGHPYNEAARECKYLWDEHAAAERRIQELLGLLEAYYKANGFEV